MPTLTPTTTDAFYGNDAHQRYDHYKHPIRDAGGNPVFIHRHGGGWQSRDKRQISIDTDEANTLAYALLGQTDVHFDVISIESRQARWDSPTTTAAFGYNEPSTVPTYYPESWMDYKRAILFFKLNATQLGINPDKVVVGGSSAGACIALWSQCTPPLVSGPSNEGSSYQGGQIQRATNIRQTTGDLRKRVDSTALGVWFHQGIADFRKRGSLETYSASLWYSIYGVANATAAAALSTAAREAVSAIAYIEKNTPYWAPVFAQYANTKNRFSGADYTAGTGTITKVGQFTASATPYANFQAGDMITASTPSGSFTVPIVSRVSNDAITVAANALGTSNLTASVSATITMGVPYGGTNRDLHDEEIGNDLMRACQRAGLPCGLSNYASFRAEPAVAWMKGLVR